MKEKNKTTSRLMYAVIGLCIALVAVLGGIIGIFAAQSQNVSSSFTVSYSVGAQVVAGVKAECYIPGSGEAAQTITTDENGNQVDNVNGYIQFNAADNNIPKSLDFGNIALTISTPQVEFYFTIHNKHESGYVQAIIGKTYSTMKNIKVKTYYYNSSSFTATNSATTIDPSLWKTNAHTINPAPDGYKFIKVVISVENRNLTAGCSGDFKLTLNYSDNAQDLAVIDSTKYLDFINSMPENFSAVSFNLCKFDYVDNNADYQSTGTDLSAAGDGSIWGYHEKINTNACNIFILSRSTISLPEGFAFWNSTWTSNSLFSHEVSFENIETSSLTSMANMFKGFDCAHLELSLFDVSNVITMESAFQSSQIKSVDLSGLNTSSVTNMANMFYSCINLVSVDLSSLNTSNITNMSNMFYGCTSLTSLNLSSFNTSNVTNMLHMFSHCTSLTSLDLASFNTSNVTNMSYMFSDCTALTSLNLSSFNTSNVTNMFCMFYDCSSLTSLDLSSFNASKVTSMSYMFQGCTSLTSLDLSSFNTSSVTNMSYMFRGCSSLTSLDLSSFNTSNVTNMMYMFAGTSGNTPMSLSRIYVSDGWSTARLSTSGGANMFALCNNLVGAVPYDFATINASMANYTTGYLTYKAA